MTKLSHTSFKDLRSKFFPRHCKEFIQGMVPSVVGILSDKLFFLMSMTNSSLGRKSHSDCSKRRPTRYDHLGHLGHVVSLISFVRETIPIVSINLRF